MTGFPITHAHHDIRVACDLRVAWGAAQLTGGCTEARPRRFALHAESQRVAIGITRIGREGVRLARLDLRAGRAADSCW